MLINRRLCLVLMTALAIAVAASAQLSVPIRSKDRSIRLDVLVAPKSGSPVTGLQKQDFTLSDNKSPQPITSFKAITSGQEPIRVFLVIDAVNVGFGRVAYVRDEVQQFLKADGGHLDYPTTLAVLTDKGMQLQKDFSKDGNSLSDSLNHYTIGLRETDRSSGIEGANQRAQTSVTAVHNLINYAATVPGRKIILWVSPGWALLSGPRVQLTSKQQQQIFSNVVGFSTQMRESNTTLYNINPLGPEEDLVRADDYLRFLNGVRTPNEVDFADLSLQVLAIQSGGLALTGSSDVSAILKRCLDDLKSWYEITFEAPASERENEYHHVEISVDKPGVSARTRSGYYAQP
jgi:VWFA-related protein